MKKIVVGMLIGAVLMFSGQALADTISNIGKKVSAEYVVTVDGKPLNVKAVNINGSTMSPNRALAEAFGYDITFKDKVVAFTKKQEGDGVSRSLVKVNNEIEWVKKYIKLDEDTMNRVDVSDHSKELTQIRLDERKALLVQLEAEKAELESQQ